MLFERITARLLMYASRAWERYQPPSPKGMSVDELDGGSTSNYVLAARFANGKSILDIGCGYGYGVAVLAKSADYVVGMDISSNAVRSAKNCYDMSNADFVIADCRNLPFSQRSFDVVVSFEVIEHLDHQEHFLIETKKVLKQNGFFALSTPNKQVEFPHPFHLHEFTPDELRSLLKKYYEDVKIFGRRIKYIRIDRLAAEERLRRSFRFRLALILNESPLKVLLLAFFIVPARARNSTFGLRIPDVKDCDFEFSEEQVEQSGTIVGLARQKHKAKIEVRVKNKA